MILICYDGSSDAKAASERGAELPKGEPATVLTVWQPFVEVLAHTPSWSGLTPVMVDFEKSTRPGARAQRIAPRRERSSPAKPAWTRSRGSARR